MEETKFIWRINFEKRCERKLGKMRRGREYSVRGERRRRKRKIRWSRLDLRDELLKNRWGRSKRGKNMRRKTRKKKSLVHHISSILKLVMSSHQMTKMIKIIDNHSFLLIINSPIMYFIVKLSVLYWYLHNYEDRDVSFVVSVASYKV